MRIDVGRKQYDSTEAKEVCSFAPLIDYSPNRFSAQDAIGYDYRLFDAGGAYLLGYRIVGQRTAFGPGFVAAEGLVPLPCDVGELIGRRVRAHPGQPVPPSNYNLKTILEHVDRTASVVNSRLAPEDIARAYLLHDLEEMKICVNVGAYRGCLAMAGRILEAVLKIALRRAGRRVEKNCLVGKLLAELEEAGLNADAGARNISNLINLQRIVRVHAKEMAPIPSGEQVVMVVYAVIDALIRRLEG